MKLNYKKIIIEAFFPIIITAILQFISIRIFGDQGKIELISNKIEKNLYQNTIAIRNLQQNKKLKNLEFIINDDINVINVTINGKEIGNKSILINDIIPNEISVVTIISDKKISDNDVTVISGNQNLNLEYFNKYSNYKYMYLVILGIYALISLIMYYTIEKKETERYENKIKENDELKEMIEKIEYKYEKLKKKMSARKTVFVKEFADVEKEKSFYQKLLLKKYDNQLSKEELEKMITKELKIFSEKKYKHLTYYDVYEIVEKALEETYKNE